MNSHNNNTLIALSAVHLTLSSSAGPVQVLRGVDLSIDAGETVSVVGPSGAGKSTLMMIMAGLERPSSGSVQVAGQELTTRSEDELALFRRDHVGIVFQAFHLVPTMTALENVAIPLEFAGRADAFERAAAELQAVGLGHRMSHYPGQLSGGEQQRVALAPHWHRNRHCCWPMNRPAIWMARPAARLSNYYSHWQRRKMPRWC